MFWSSSFRPPLPSWRRRNRQPTSSQPAIRRCSHEHTRTFLLEEKTTHSVPCKSLWKNQYLEKRGESCGSRPLQANRQFPFILTEAFNVLLFLWQRLTAHVHVWHWVNRGGWSAGLSSAGLKLEDHQSRHCGLDHSQHSSADMLYFYNEECLKVLHHIDGSLYRSSIVILMALAHSCNNVPPPFKVIMSKLYIASSVIAANNCLF